MDNPLTPENESILLEDALDTFPLASMPREITMDVLRRIQSSPSPRPFRLTWTDVLLAITLSLSITAVWFSLQNLPPIVVAQVHKTSVLFYQYIFVNARWLIPALLFGLAGFLGALTIPYLRQELTRQSR
ncbi:MAG TPA: hypothetical protein VFY25_06140 [Anaerolineales bacterium]|nr:hypothetical protein [Anaerolineales bacterium]